MVWEGRGGAALAQPPLGAANAEWQYCSDHRLMPSCAAAAAAAAASCLQAVLTSADELVWEAGANKQVNMQGVSAVEAQYAFQA
jgi:hypothetical protein